MSVLKSLDHLPNHLHDSELHQKITDLIDKVIQDNYEGNYEAVRNFFKLSSDHVDIRHLVDLLHGTELLELLSEGKEKQFLYLLSRIYELKGTRRGLQLLLSVIGLGTTTFKEWYEVNALVDAGTDPNYTEKIDRCQIAIDIEINDTISELFVTSNVEEKLIKAFRLFLWICIDVGALRWKKSIEEVVLVDEENYISKCISYCETYSPYRFAAIDAGLPYGSTMKLFGESDVWTGCGCPDIRLPSLIVPPCRFEDGVYIPAGGPGPGNLFEFGWCALYFSSFSFGDIALPGIPSYGWHSLYIGNFIFGQEILSPPPIAQPLDYHTIDPDQVWYYGGVEPFGPSLIVGSFTIGEGSALIFGPSVFLDEYQQLTPAGINYLTSFRPSNLDILKDVYLEDTFSDFCNNLIFNSLFSFGDGSHFGDDSLFGSGAFHYGNGFIGDCSFNPSPNEIISVEQFALIDDEVATPSEELVTNECNSRCEVFSPYKIKALMDNLPIPKRFGVSDIWTGCGCSDPAPLNTNSIDPLEVFNFGDNPIGGLPLFGGPYDKLDTFETIEDVSVEDTYDLCNALTFGSVYYFGGGLIGDCSSGTSFTDSVIAIIEDFEYSEYGHDPIIGPNMFFTGDGFVIISSVGL